MEDEIKSQRQKLKDEQNRIKKNRSLWNRFMPSRVEIDDNDNSITNEDIVTEEEKIQIEKDINNQKTEKQTNSEIEDWYRKEKKQIIKQLQEQMFSLKNEMNNSLNDTSLTNTEKLEIEDEYKSELEELEEDYEEQLNDLKDDFLEKKEYNNEDNDDYEDNYNVTQNATTPTINEIFSHINIAEIATGIIGVAIVIMVGILVLSQVQTSLEGAGVNESLEIDAIPDTKVPLTAAFGLIAVGLIVLAFIGLGNIFR